MSGPNESSTPFGDADEVQEGVYRDQEALSMDLEEDEVISIIGNRIDDGRTFWNKEYDLDKIRKKNEERWLNRNFEVSDTEDLYDFQADYRDNRIFISIETLASYLVNRIPEPIVVEAQDGDASRELAMNFGMVLKQTAHDVFLKEKLMMVARHLLIGYRIGLMKITWDESAGMRKNDGSYSGYPYVNWVRPHKIVLDAETKNFEDPSLIAENVDTTLEELGIMFDDKKDEILKESGTSQADKMRLGKKAKYWEVWFKYFNKDGNPEQGVGWKFNKLLLDYDQNPYYNYSGKGSNFFDRPKMPYVGFNFLQLGKWALDDTSLTEQASKLQDILERRGRQIVDNADQAHSTKVFNTQMISSKAVQKYIGKPTQNIMVKGDVNKAFKREAPPLLPSYVLQDKYDARTEIDNIFGTHAPLRGEKTESPTLGQEIISQKADLGRIQYLASEVERGAEEVYKHIAQMYKVYAEEEHIFRYVGEDGPTTFFEFSGDKIEDGVQIKIQTGSSLPDDKTADKMEALELAKLQGQIDPLTLAEKLHLPNPKQAAIRMVNWILRPDKYISEDLQAEEGSKGMQEAQRTIERINAGQNIPPKENPSKEYISVYSQYLESPQFKRLTPEQQALHVAHVRGTVQQAKGELGQEDQSEGGFMARVRGLFGGREGGQY